MSIQQPTSPPAITELPEAPNSQNQTPSQFDATANTFVSAQVNLVPEQNSANAWVNDTATITYNNALSAQSSATSASLSASDALSANNLLGDWSSLTGSAAIGDSVYHDDGMWRVLVNITDITTSEPSLANSDYALTFKRATDLDLETGVQYSNPDSEQVKGFVQRNWSDLTTSKTYKETCFYFGKEYTVRNPVDDPTIGPPDSAGRSFHNPEGFGFLEIPTIALQSGDTLEFEFEAPATNNALLYMLDHNSGSDRIQVALNSNGNYLFPSLLMTMEVDGVAVTNSTTYPTDGLTHSARLNIIGICNLSRIFADFQSGNLFKGKIYNVKVIRAGQQIHYFHLRNDAIDYLDGNLVKDEEFTNQENFTKGAGWSVKNNSAIAVSGTQSILSTEAIISNGDSIRIIYDAIINTGSLTIINSGLAANTISGKYDETATFLSNEIAIQIQKSSDFSGSIKNLRVIKDGDQLLDGTENGTILKNFDRYWQLSDGSQFINKSAGVIKLNDTNLALDTSNTYKIQPLANANAGDKITCIRVGSNTPTLEIDAADISAGVLITHPNGSDTNIEINTSDVYTLIYDGANLQLKRG